MFVGLLLVKMLKLGVGTSMNHGLDVGGKFVDATFQLNVKGLNFEHAELILGLGRKHVF